MNSNQQRIPGHLVIGSPDQRSEVLTEGRQTGPRESRFSVGTLAIFAVLALTAIGVVLFMINNRNANLAANQPTSHQQPATTIQQQAAPPRINQQQASGQQAPGPVPAPNPNYGASDDASMLKVAVRTLNDQPGMTTVTVTISEGRVVLTGNVNSAATKAKAEQIVKAVQGVKSIENKIVITG
jgi:uncharacterized phage infection (PIP) family protein YhgE